MEWCGCGGRRSGAEQHIGGGAGAGLSEAFRIRKEYRMVVTKVNGLSEVSQVLFRQVMDLAWCSAGIDTALAEV